MGGNPPGFPARHITIIISPLASLPFSDKSSQIGEAVVPATFVKLSSPLSNSPTLGHAHKATPTTQGIACYADE